MTVEGGGRRWHKGKVQKVGGGGGRVHPASETSVIELWANNSQNKQATTEGTEAASP